MADADRLDLLSVNTIRRSMPSRGRDPGTPIDAAPTVYCLWPQFLRYDPEAADWPDLDRFVLSSGHASAMLYSLLFQAQLGQRGGRARRAWNDPFAAYRGQYPDLADQIAREGAAQR